MSTLSVLIFACIFFNEFGDFGLFHKIKYTQNFPLNSIFENRYTLSMKKIHSSFIFEKKFFFLESINNKFFHRDLTVFPLILKEKLAAYPLVQLPFSYSVF